MRATLCTALAIFAAPLMMAEPVSLKQAVKELSDRGSKNVQTALFEGSPFIQANLDDQGIYLRLTECEGDDYVCRVATFSSCREYADFTREQALEVANAYAGKWQSRGSAHVADDSTLGQKFCVRLRIDLHEEDSFDMADVFDWQLTMRDFFKFTDTAADRNIARRLLGQ